MISILFFISSAMASPPQMWVRPNFDGRRYLVQSECPGSCIPIMENDQYADEEVSDYTGGHWVLNQSKKDARDAEITAADTKKTKRAGAKDSLKNASNLAQVKQALMDLLGLE